MHHNIVYVYKNDVSIHITVDNIYIVILNGFIMNVPY